MLKFLLVGLWEFLMYCYKINDETKSYEENDMKYENFNHEERVYAIDFDNTIAYTKFPKIIKPLPYAMEVLQILTKDPCSTLILWTCREKEDLKEALDFCKIYGIEFDYVNENCKRNLDLYDYDCRKVSADVYIDDHSYQGIEGVEKLWEEWYFWMKENNLIK